MQFQDYDFLIQIDAIFYNKFCLFETPNKFWIIQEVGMLKLIVVFGV
jgi:hypothetical protein